MGKHEYKALCRHTPNAEIKTSYRVDASETHSSLKALFAASTPIDRKKVFCRGCIACSCGWELAEYEPATTAGNLLS